MKRLFVFAGLATAFFVFSCTKEVQAPDGGNPTVRTTVNVSLSEKTVLGELEGTVRKVYWTNGDSICINGISSAPLEGLGEDATSANFEFEGLLETPYKVIYPASAWVDETHVTLSALQPAGENDNVGQDALPMYALSEDGSSIGMRQLCAIVKFNIKLAAEGDSDVIDRIEFQGNAGEQVSGEFGFNYATGTLSGGSTADADKVVAVECGKAPTAEGIKVILAIPAGTYESGITVRIIDVNGHVQEKVIDREITFERAKSASFTALDFDPVCELVIMNAGELKAWGEGSTFKDAASTVKLGADIDLGGYEWTPIADFRGTFDGQNHSITNFSVKSAQYTGFFGRTYGSISNVTFGSDSDSSTITSSWSDSGNAYCGAIANLVEGSSASNVTNWAAVTYSGDCAATLFIGGICGSVATAIAPVACTNNGKVSVTGTVTSASNVGGLFGQFNKAITVEGCTNNGDVDYAATRWDASVNFGGIVGYNNVNTTLKNCTNNGNLCIDNASHSNTSETSSGQNSLGGIFGYTNAGGGSIINCTNTGTISKLAEDAKRNYYLGGIMGYINSCDFTISGCTNAPTATITSDKKSYSYNNLGGIVGYTKGLDKVVTITSCTNNAAISANNSTNSYLGESGIVGFLSSGATITDCHNTGAITRNSGCIGNYEYIGGIIASIPQSITAAIKVSDCTNSGSFTIIGKNKSANSDRCGGIVGSVASAATFTNCDNSGALTNSTGSTDLRLGGIVGSTSSKASTFTDCDNTGAVSCTKATTSADLGGICGYNGQTCTFKNCTNSAEVTSSANVGKQRVGGIIGNSANKAKLNSCSSTGNLATYGNDQTLCGAITGYSTSASTVTTCSVSAIDVCGTTLTASNYGSYLKGTGSTADTNLTTTNVSFIGEEASNSGTNENFGGFSDITLE